MASADQLFLHVIDPVAGESTVLLAAGVRITLGRAPSNDIVLHDERASRVHAEILSAPGGWLIRDLQSRNGTIVNGETVVSERPLVPGDLITVGLVQLQFGMGEPPTGAGTAVGRPSTRV